MAATEGNAGAAAASAIGANVAMGMMGNVVAAGAIAIAGKDDKLAAGLVDVGQNIIATAAGAGIGSAFGGSASMNGAQIGSSLQQYNWGGSSAATATALNNARPILAAIAAGGTLAEIGAVVAGVVLAPEVAAVGAAGAVGAAVIASIIYAENKKDDSTAHNATNTANGDTSSQMTAVPSNKDDQKLSTPSQERNPEDNTVSTPIQTPQKGDNIVSGTPSDDTSNPDLGKDQGFTPNQQNPGDHVVTSDHPAWLNPDRTLIGEPGSGEDIREIHVDGNPDQAAQDFIDKVIGDREINKEASRDLPPIKGVSGSKVIVLTDGTTITYRPAGAAGPRTPKDVVNIDINDSPEVKNWNNGQELRLKFKFKGKK